MKNFMKNHYDHYYIQTDDGQLIETTRAVCFAPRDNSASPFKQRWLHDIEAGYIVRLTHNESANRLHRMNASTVRKEERYHERKYACLNKDSGNCDSDCKNCQKNRISRTVDLDKPVFSGNDCDDSEQCMSIAAPDIFLEIEENEDKRLEVKKLYGAIKKLSKEYQQLIILHFFKSKTHAEIASILGKDRTRVTRQLQTAIKELRKILS